MGFRATREKGAMLYQFFTMRKYLVQWIQAFHYSFETRQKLEEADTQIS